MSSAKDFILEKYSAMVDEPFLEVASAIRVLITLARDCEAKDVSMCFQTSVVKGNAVT
jgi:hypothetical protein